MFVNGGGVGGKEKRLATTTTEDQCADLVRRQQPNANGATWGDGECFAEFGATGNDGDKNWRTCVFEGRLL